MVKIRTTRLVGAVLVLISIFIIIGYLSIQKKEKAVIADAVEAIPINASFIFETKNIVNLNQNLIKQSQIWAEIIQFEQLNNFKSQLSSLDSVIAKSDFLQKFLKNQKVLISSHLVGTDRTSFLFTCKVSNKKIQKELVDELRSLSIITDSLSENTRVYNSTRLYTIQGNQNKFFFALVDNILIFSKDELIVENSIRQKNSESPITIQAGFSQTAKTVSKDKNHILFSYQNFGKSFPKFFSSTFSRKIKKLQNFANWAALDISIQTDNIRLSGYTFVENSSDYFLKILENSKPQKIDNTELLPEKTSEFIFFGFDDVANFYSKYEKFLNSKNLNGTYKILTDEFNKKFDTDIQSTVLQLIDNSITFANVNFNNSIDEEAQFTIIKLKNTQELHQYLEQITNYYKEKNNIDKKFSIDFEIDNSTSHKIFKLPVKNFVKILFGELAYFPKQEYYFFYNQYIIFTNSADNAKQFINNIYRKNTLANNENFNKYLNSSDDKANLFYYSNYYFSSSKNIDVLNSAYKDIYKKNINFFNKIQYLTIQFSYQKNNLYTTNVSAFFNNELSSKGLNVWETELKDNIITKPFFFMNHYSFEREVFVQDKQNIIYLLDKNGNILWKKQLNEAIVGDIYMVDLYNNKKFQLMFATENFIIALDRNGDLIDNYPVELDKSTKIGISIIDYEGNKDYRIFTPCIDKKIYLYDKTGKEVEGWSKLSTESEITSKIKYFYNDGKDYLVCSDKTKPYILNRKGEIRVEIEENFPVSDNGEFYFQKNTGSQKASFVTTDASGKIIHINMNGNVKTTQLLSMSKKHQFVASDINNDDMLDYIISDDKTLFVYNFDGSKVFSYTFNGAIENKPIILKFSADNVKIGVVIPSENKVYIVNSDGTLMNNFPVQGNSIFSVGMLSSEKDFSLIVGNNNFIFNYLVL